MRSRADRYDWELNHVAGRSDQDVAFYLDALPAAPRRVLELGCGTGRVGLRLAAAGCTVVGLDVDREMLMAARGRGLRSVVCADMRRFRLQATFGVVAIPYNSLQLLDDDGDRVACLRSAFGHLAPRGRLAFETTDFLDGLEGGNTGEVLLAHDSGTELWGELVVQGSWALYRRRFVENGEAVEDEVSLQSLTEGDVRRLVAEAGGTVIRDERHGRATRWVALPSGSDLPGGP